jgi:hypothetical protein
LRKKYLVRFSIKEHRLVFVLEVLDRVQVVVLEGPSDDDRSWRRPNSNVKKKDTLNEERNEDRLHRLLESIPAHRETTSH